MNLKFFFKRTFYVFCLAGCIIMLIHVSSLSEFFFFQLIEATAIVAIIVTITLIVMWTLAYIICFLIEKLNLLNHDKK
jgi:hypothetical protein